MFLGIVTRMVEGLAREQDKSLDEIPGWDVWLCTSGANKSSADWLRKKLNARPTQLVDGTVSVASVTPSVGKVCFSFLVLIKWKLNYVYLEGLCAWIGHFRMFSAFGSSND